MTREDNKGREKVEEDKENKWKKVTKRGQKDC